MSDFTNAVRASVVGVRRDNDSFVLVAEHEDLGGTPPATRRFEFRMAQGMATHLFDELGVALEAWD